MSGDDDVPEAIPPEDRPEDLPLQPNAADKREIKKRTVRKKVREREEVAFVRGLLGTPEGRRFLWGILAAAHTFEERFGVSHYGFPIEQETWFNAGQQQLGQRLYLSWDFIDHDGVSLMLREHDPRFLARAG